MLPRLAAAARRRRTGERLTDLRLGLLRAQAREERALAAACAALERQIAALLRQLGTSLPGLCGLGALGAPSCWWRSGIRAASARRTPSPPTPARPRSPPPPPRRGGTPSTTGSTASGTAASTRCSTAWPSCASASTPRRGPTPPASWPAGKTPRDAQRIVKRRLARLVWQTMMRDLRPSADESAGAAAVGGPEDVAPANTGEGWFAREPAALIEAGAGRHPQGRSAAEQPSGARLDAPAGAEPPAPLGLPEPIWPPT